MKKILIVEDDMEITGLFCEIFQGLDEYETCYAIEGYQALRLAADFKPDMVLLDIQLPDLNGFEVCSRIKTDRAFSGTKVLMISGLAQDPDCLKSHDAGADDCITKPFISWQLLERIEYLLGSEGE